jgi:hypothetical protein
MGTLRISVKVLASETVLRNCVSLFDYMKPAVVSTLSAALSKIHITFDG